MQEIAAGEYLAKPIKARIVESAKTHNRAVEIMFKINMGEDQAPAYLAYQAWRTPAAMERTVETLLLLGWNGSEQIDGNGVLTDPKVFNWETEVKIVIEIEQNTGQNGKVYNNPKIKWVNRVGGSQFAGVKPEQLRASPDDGLKAAWLQAKGGGMPNAQPKQQSKPATVNEEEIPW